MPLALYRVEITETFPPREGSHTPRPQRHSANIVADSAEAAMQGASDYIAATVPPGGSTTHQVGAAFLEVHVAAACIGGFTTVVKPAPEAEAADVQEGA